jgi:hypothetical protein
VRVTVATALAAAGGVGDLELEEELHGHLLAEAAVGVREAGAETRRDFQRAAGLGGRGIVALALLLDMEAAARLEVRDDDVGVVALSQVDLDRILAAKAGLGELRACLRQGRRRGEERHSELEHFAQKSEARQQRRLKGKRRIAEGEGKREETLVVKADGRGEGKTREQEPVVSLART